jgi:DNA ligase (NAD+)
MGFSAAPERRCVRGLAGLLSYFDDIRQRRESLPYDIDGVVYKVDDLPRRNASASIPRSPPAFRDCAQVPGRGSRHRTARHLYPGRPHRGDHAGGALAPVFVGGVTVTNATLHNEAEARRKDVRIGDTVVVRRAGDVIPEVVSVVRQATESDLRRRTAAFRPSNCRQACPVCGSQVVRHPDEAIARCSGGLSVRRSASRRCCTSPAARDGHRRDWVTSWSSNSSTTPSSRPRPTSTSLACWRWPISSAWPRNPPAICWRQSSKSKQTTLARFIFALGIRNVGEATAKDLARISAASTA